MCLKPVSQKQYTSQPRAIKAVKSESHSSSSDEEYLYPTNKDKSKIPTVNGKVSDVEIKMIVDTGTSTDILDEDTFTQFNCNNDVVLQPTTKRLYVYGSTDQLTTMGQYNGTVSFQDNQQDVSIHVLKGSHGSLLSYKMATALGILNLGVRHVQDHTYSTTHCPQSNQPCFKAMANSRC